MEAPVGKEYAGPSGIGRDSVWLTAEDLVGGRDVEVEIARVVLFDEVKFQDAKKPRKNLLALEFVGKARTLGLNSTNRKTLNKMFGNVVKAWKGQKITLYVTQTQSFGETVDCIRIRDRGSRAASAAEEFLHDDEPKPSGATREPGEEGDEVATEPTPRGADQGRLV